MKGKILALFLSLVICIPQFGCGETYAKQARDIIATSNALLMTAQAQYKASCIANPAQSICVAINSAGAAQNLALDGLSLYCGFTASSPAGTVCTPVSSALSALQAAIANLNTITADLRTLLNIKGALTQPAIVSVAQLQWEHVTRKTLHPELIRAMHVEAL